MLRILISLPPKCCRAAAGLAASQVAWLGLKLGCVASDSRVGPSAPALVLRQWQRRRMPTGPPDMAAAAGSGVAQYSVACRTCRPQPRCTLRSERKRRGPASQNTCRQESKPKTWQLHQALTKSSSAASQRLRPALAPSHMAGGADKAMGQEWRMRDLAQVICPGCLGSPMQDAA